MPKKNTIAFPSAAATPPLPARFTEILAALPIFAWVENSKGEILARNFGLAADTKGRARLPSAPRIPNTKHGGLGDAALPVITAYPLPPIKGCPQRLRLVTLVSSELENDGHARVISTLFALLLGTPRPDSLQLTPQQRDIYGKLSLGDSYKEIAFSLGITHNALLVHLTRMRKRLGDGIIPRLRRCSFTTERC